jgi:hypothetical protein
VTAAPPQVFGTVLSVRPTTVLGALVLLLAACAGAAGEGAAPATSVTVAAPSTPAPSTVTAPPAPATLPAPTPTTLAPTTAAPTTAAPTRTSCAAVVHIGDSTSVGMVSTAYLLDAELRLDAQYARVGVVDPRLEISGARSTLETLEGQVNARDVAQAQRDSGFRGCWVFALGTTDSANVAVGSSMGRRARIDRMMAVAAGDPVLWVNVKTLKAQGAWSNPVMQEWNLELAKAQADYPNLRIYDWASVVQDDWFSDDRIHYTPAGYALRARLIADALVAAYPAP